MRSIYILAMVCFAGISIVSAEPTAKTYIFAAMESNFNDELIDSLAKYFDVVITHEGQRDYNPMFRDSNEVTWRRDKPPVVLLYKDAMTLIGPVVDTLPPYDTTYWGDNSYGGGASVGGFWHFDSIFFGYGAYNPDTFFMMKSDSTYRYDDFNRVHAGDAIWWGRWAMDYGESDWQSFYGCSTKVQCLRDYQDSSYNETYFDGIFMDNLLQYVNNYGYRMFPMQYMLDTIQGIVDSVKFRNAVYSFAQTVSAEYHNSQTPPQHGSQILGVANLNNTYRTTAYDSIWRRNVNVLDGGMEESFVTMGCSFTNWYKFLHEISIAESLGKTCLMCKKVEGFLWDNHTPFGYTEFDSTDLIFGFASFLMAFDSMACFYFTPKDSQHYTFVCRAPIIDIDIGKPMGKYILKSDSLAYRYYEEGVVFANATQSSKTAGFSGDTLLLLDAKAEVKAQVELFTLNHHEGAICLYPLNYFHGSSFEPDDRLCWEDYCLEVQGIINYGAERMKGYPPNGVSPHSGEWMYKIYGEDISPDTSFIIFKVFPYDILIADSMYFSFWIYVDYAPGDSAPIGLDCLLKSGKRLSEWTKFGRILDQYGREINPAGRRVPEGAWYQYVFSFNPAVRETIDHIEVVYFDESSGTGNFCAYIDDVEILDSFPIPDCWHCEKFPTDPTYGDPNFYMNFIAQGDSVRLIINPQGDGGEGPHWVNPIPGIRNNITDIPVDSTTTVIWSQYDKAHSLILSLFVHDNQENDRWLMYAKNASNWWPQTGWVDMGDTARHYNMWEGFFRNIRDDYTAEYGGEVEPESIIELRLEHFARSEWVGDSGGTIGNLFIVPFTQEFTINQNQTYTNMPYVALRTKVTSEIVDSMNIHQDYSDSLTDSTGWIAYDTSYCWYLREGEGNNTVYIQYKVGGFSESPVYCDTIIFDKTLPTGSFAINNDDKFTNTSDITLKNSVNDTQSGMSKMRYGNKYLENLVINSAFDDTSHWKTDTAIYHDSLKLFEIPIQTTGNYFYQSILPESLAEFDNDTMLLWIDLVDSTFIGIGKVEFLYIYGFPRENDSIDPRGQYPFGTIITISQGTNARVSHYNLFSYFKYHPEPPAGKILLEARVRVFIDTDDMSTGKLFIDNFRLDVVSPFDSSRFENYDSLKEWTLISGNGVRKVYGQFSDGAGNETGVFFDSIIVDTTKPAANISSPQDDQIISGNVGITGWAYDYADPEQHFKLYELKYQKFETEPWYGIDPVSLFYTPVEPSLPPKTLAKWNTQEVTDNHGNGSYYLKLTVRDSAENYQDDTIRVYINNLIRRDGEISGFSHDVYGLAAQDEIYIGEIGTGKIYRYNTNYQMIDTFNLIDSVGIGFPLAMALDDSGKLWATNITSHLVNRFTPQGNLLLQFGSGFSLPSGIGLDNSGNIWVSDRMHHKIKKFNQSGDTLFEFGTKGREYGEIKRPIGIALLDDKIYIADSRNRRISVFDTLGDFIRVIGESAGLLMPFGLVIDSTGCIFVSDFIGNRVIEFGPSGNQLLEIDSILDAPSGLALSPDANILYVSDTKHKRVLAFTVRGEPPQGGGPQSYSDIHINRLMFDVYPSIFSEQLIIRLQGMGESSKSMEIKIYDVSGRLVKQFNYSTDQPFNQIIWRGQDDLDRQVSCGVYFIRLAVSPVGAVGPVRERPDYIETKKVILLK